MPLASICLASPLPDPSSLHPFVTIRRSARHHAQRFAHSARPRPPGAQPARSAHQPPAASHARIGALLDGLDKTKHRIGPVSPLARRPQSIAMVLAGNLTLQSLERIAGMTAGQPDGHHAARPTVCQPTGAKQAALPSINSLAWSPDSASTSPHPRRMLATRPLRLVYLDVDAQGHRGEAGAESSPRSTASPRRSSYAPDGKHLSHALRRRRLAVPPARSPP